MKLLATTISFLAAASIASALPTAHYAAPTPPPEPHGYDSAMPYDDFLSGGYKSLDCGYGYNRDASSRCVEAVWVRTQLHSLLSRFDLMLSY